jgi:PhnB protein
MGPSSLAAARSRLGGTSARGGPRRTRPPKVVSSGTWGVRPGRLFADETDDRGKAKVRRSTEQTETEEPMAIRQLNPYLNFDGTAEKAIKLYESALGAKSDNLMRFGDTPGTDVRPEYKSRVMHARLHVGQGLIMVSDTPPGMPVATDSNTHVCLDFDDTTDMAKKFDALSRGGKVTMPLQDTFWGARFGMLTDEYGIKWMFNCEQKKS